MFRSIIIGMISFIIIGCGVTEPNYDDKFYVGNWQDSDSTTFLNVTITEEPLVYAVRYRLKDSSVIASCISTALQTVCYRYQFQQPIDTVRQQLQIQKTNAGIVLIYSGNIGKVYLHK